jgi:predicted RNA-binding Zn ribbon-like protein
LDSFVALDTNLLYKDSVVSKKTGASPSAGRFLFIGGRLCVDFANTVYAPGSPGGALGGFDDVVAFLEAAGAVDGGEGRRLRTLARAGPRRSATAFARALALRDMLRALLAALGAGEPVHRQWIELVNGILRSDLGYPQLVARRGGWCLAPMASRADPLAALVPVARSAAELIQEGPDAPVRKCASPRCVLYFYGASRTGKRRWCSMAMCGNRMKVAAHARRGRAMR